MKGGHHPHSLPPEKAAEPYFKCWDDAAARLVRSVFLLGGGLLGLVLLPLVFSPVLEAVAERQSLAGFYRFATSLGVALIFLGGALGALLWGVVVLAGAVNAAILAASQPVPPSAGRLVSWVLRIFSRERPFLSLALPAMSLGVILTVVLVSGIDASKELIERVLRVLGVIAP